MRTLHWRVQHRKTDVEGSSWQEGCDFRLAAQLSLGRTVDNRETSRQKRALVDEESRSGDTFDRLGGPIHRC